MVHLVDVLGSSIEPKVKWFIAKGMLREQVIVFDPETNRERKVKSFEAYHLKNGLNWWQWLGLPEPKTPRAARQVPGDMGVHATVDLTPVQWQPKRPTKIAKPSVVMVKKCVGEDGVKKPTPIVMEGDNG